METSMEEARLPQLWKKASVIPLRKAGKDDYTKTKSYRPISLLQTISEILESVLATRISYLVEEHRLLPRTHFGARKQTSSIDALTYLQEKIYRACTKSPPFRWFLSTSRELTTTWPNNQSWRACGGDGYPSGW